MTKVPTIKAVRIILAGCMLALAGAVHAVHGLVEMGSHIQRTLCDSPEQAVKTFLVAVHREQLTVFHYILDSSMLKPLRVEVCLRTWKGDAADYVLLRTGRAYWDAGQSGC
jgi:hypothetical protein